MSGMIHIETHELTARGLVFHVARVLGDFTDFRLVTSTADPAQPATKGVAKPIEDFMGYGDLVTSGPAHTQSEGFVGPIILDGIGYKDFTSPTSPKGLEGRGTEVMGVRADGTAKIYSAYDGDTLQTMLTDGVKWTYGFAGAPVRDGVAQDLDGSGRYVPFAFPSARQVIGVDADNKPMLLTIAGKSNYRGATLNETGLIAQEVGMVQAANMDGGGTVQSAFEGRVYQASTDTGQRRGMCCAVVVSV